MLLMLYPAQPEEGDLRLMNDDSFNGTTLQSGRLEIYRSAWGSVCLDRFDVYEADLACAQLGFSYADILGSTSQFG